MSQAEDLLNNLNEGDTTVTHIHEIADDDAHFVISPITRNIEYLENKELKIMQFDHNSERFTFELPRYVESHDMSLCNVVHVHWVNRDKATGAENADVSELYNLHIDSKNAETVVCSWDISREATQLAGTLSFLLEFICRETEQINYSWHSDIFQDVTIKEGMNNGNKIEANYSHLLEQWRYDVFETIAELETRILLLEQRLNESAT